MLTGSSLFTIGSVISFYLALLKIVGGEPLSNRPLLILGILFIVFGIQTFSVGLVGELIIFSHVKDLKNYQIEEIIE